MSTECIAPKTPPKHPSEGYSVFVITLEKRTDEGESGWAWSRSLTIVATDLASAMGRAKVLEPDMQVVEVERLASSAIVELSYAHVHHLASSIDLAFSIG